MGESDPGGIPTRSADIQRNRHLLGAIRRNFGLRRSFADRLEYIQTSPKNLGASRIRPPAGASAKGDSGEFRPTGRNSAKSPLTWGDMGEFVLHGSMGECVGPSENPEKYRMLDDPPPGRFCGGGARPMGFPTRSTEIQRTRHLLGEIGWNFAPRGPMVDCARPRGIPARNPPKAPLTWRDRAEFRTSRIICRSPRISSGNPEKPRRVADPPSGGPCSKGRDSWGISARAAEIQRNRHMIGAMWMIPMEIYAIDYRSLSTKFRPTSPIKWRFR